MSHKLISLKVIFAFIFLTYGVDMKDDESGRSIAHTELKERVVRLTPRPNFSKRSLQSLSTSEYENHSQSNLSSTRKAEAKLQLTM